VATTTFNGEFAIHLFSEDQKILLKIQREEMKKFINGAVGGSWGTIVALKKGVGCFGSTKGKARCGALCI
jgi:hypothetical protein